MTRNNYFRGLVRGAALLLMLSSPAACQRGYREMPDHAAVARMEEARRRAEAEDLRRMNEKMLAFVHAWNEFTREYTERGTFNLRKARTITKAWKSLEKEEGWPKK